MKKLLTLLMALAMCLSLFACQSGTDDSAAESPDPAAESADPAVSDAASDDSGDEAEPTEEIVADLTLPMFEFSSGLPDDGIAMTVNGVEIPNELYLYWLSADCYQMVYQYAMYGISADFTDDEIVAYLFSDSQSAVTYYAVLRELCAEYGVGMTEEDETDLQSRIDESLESQGMTMEELLRTYGLTEESFRYLYESSYLFSNLSDAYMGEPTSADLEQYVEDNGIFSCKHILLQTVDEDQTDDDGNVTQTAEEYNAEQKTLAEDLLAQLQAEGDNVENLMDQLAEEYSEDGRNEDGTLASPDGYTFDSSSSLIDGFREGTLALAVGEVGLVETDYGYHVILRLPVDPSDYQEDWVSAGTDAAVTEAMEAADVTVSEGIETLDLNTFYNRYTAYISALYDELNPEEESTSTDG